jgi:rRNA maturation RNase YbeY
MDSVLRNYGVEDSSICVVFTVDSTLHKFKKEYFGQDEYTDVIAFSLNDEGKPLEGEIYVSIDRILENSTELNVPWKEEILRVIIHGILHLLGYDDSNESQCLAMCKEQEKWVGVFKSECHPEGK